MLSPADRALVAADAAVPGLAVLLDDAATLAWLRARGTPALAVRRRYLRYKPATSCVLEAEVVTPGGPFACFLTAYERGDADKIEKTVAKAPRESVLSVDLDALVLAAAPAADRDLPALAVLAHPARRRRLLRRLLPGQRGLREAVLQPLHHKPQRRWVGLLRPRDAAPVVLRAYRPEDAPAALRAAAALAEAPLRTPRVLGADLDLGVAALEYLPGETLDVALATGRAGYAETAAAGAMLAALHSSAVSAPGPASCCLPAGLRRAEDGAQPVTAAAAHLGVLLPDLAGRARRLAEALAGELAAWPVDPVALHGDFSADQVVVGPSGGPALIDLDTACAGDATVDLASAAAAAVSAAIAGDGAGTTGWVRVLHEGYASRRPLPEADRLAAHTAAFLLRRAVEPFRLCAPAWPAAAERLLAHAEAALSADGLSADGPSSDGRCS